MFATIVATRLLRAGFKTGYLLLTPTPAPDQIVLESPAVFRSRGEFDPADLENAIVLYVPGLKKCVEPGNDDWPEDWPEDPATGILTADVLMIERLDEVNPHSTPWGVNYMGDGGWEDVKNAAPELHAIVHASRVNWETEELERRERGARSAPLRELDEPRYDCEFIGLWQPETSLDWESGHTEIDAINFVGEGQIVPLERKPNPPLQPLSVQDVLSVEEEINRASIG